jgi:hypothetical protein
MKITINNTNICWRWKPSFDKPNKIEDIIPFFVWVKKPECGLFLLSLFVFTWQINYDPIDMWIKETKIFNGKEYLINVRNPKYEIHKDTIITIPGYDGKIISIEKW